MTNPFFDALEKLAFEPEERDLEPRETYDPVHPGEDKEERDRAVGAAVMGQTDEEVEEEIDEIMDRLPPVDHGYHFEQRAELIEEALPKLAMFAKLIDWSNGIDADESWSKQASELLDSVLADEQGDVLLDKMANEMFSEQSNVEQLYSDEGVQYVHDRLAHVWTDELTKEASDQKWYQTLGQTFMDMFRPGQIQASIDDRKRLKDRATEEMTHIKNMRDQNFSVELQNQLQEARGRAIDLNGELTALEQRQNSAKVARGAAYGALGLGALYAGKKVYDMLSDKEKQASFADNMLLHKVANDTLNSEYVNGGMTSMSKQVVRDFLKLAGAAALIELANNEGLDIEIRKEASDQFDAIAGLGSSAMGEALIKTAQALYPEEQLHEIVAGLHTDEIVEKVAFFIEASEMSSDELNKVASAAGVVGDRLRAMGTAIKDAVTNVPNNLSAGYEKAVGSAREYIGELGHSAKRQGQAFAAGAKRTAGGYAEGYSSARTVAGKAGALAPATGLAGGGIVAGAAGLAGYNALNNPEDYGIEQTASMIEDAVMAKQAAIDTYMQADNFIKRFAR